MSHQDKLNLAALQITPTSNLSDTLLQITTLIERAQRDLIGLDCIVLPEYTFGTFREWTVMKTDSDKLVQQILQAMSKIACQYKIHIVAGTLPFQTKKKHWRNRSFLISASGDIMGAYDKQHPFRAEKIVDLEPGTQTPIFQLGPFQMAILICSDLWFHNLVAKIASKVDFLAVPAMTTVLDANLIQYGQWAWQSLVGVRAKEYVIPIVSADQAFREYAPNVFTCGGSCIADPSYRFVNNESPFSQALKRTPDEKPYFVSSQISLRSVREYATYRREVGLRN